ncbi:phage portal protein [Mesomycoplasma lagogenitalium]|uniref:Phage portal protein n=1 Tax=Mesomycoplasma lagogenitalium TaxID=171286 RepID=A0ABY8LTC1_9BACT|nr:phage portal protein [Mesomycoplasma lagogenitalium]WGI36488.1 phage portal protein [Mesomycoplasma lagogenitalium]
MTLKDKIKNFFKLKKIDNNHNYQDFNIPLNFNFSSSTIRTLSEHEFLTFGLCVRAFQLIANDIGKVNFRHIKYNENEEGETILNSPISKLLNKKINDNLTPWEFKKIIIWNLLIYGVAPIYKIFNENGEVEELAPIYPNYIYKVEESGKLFYILKRNGKELLKFNDFEIIWIEFEQVKGFDNVNIRSLFQSTISKIKENELAMMNAIKNDISYSAFIKIKDTTNKQQREQANLALKEMIENHKRSGSFAVVLDDKWDLGKASDIVNMRIDFQTRNSIGREFAASLGIPPSKLGIDDPNKYNSSAELNKDYVDNALKPILINICQKLSFSLLKNENEEITFKPLDLLKLDIKTIQEFASSAINNGYATANEIRALIGLDKHPDGDKLLINSTLIPITAINNQFLNQSNDQDKKGSNEVYSTDENETIKKGGDDG